MLRRQGSYEHIDAANVDLKGFTEEFYRDVCAGHLRPVLDTLVYLKSHLKSRTNVWLEITTLLIPGLNDSDDELRRLTGWVAENLGPGVPQTRQRPPASRPQWVSSYQSRPISSPPHS